MKCKLVITEPAQEDLKNIVAYIAADNINAAIKLHDNIIKTITHLEGNPEMGSFPRIKKLKLEGYRKLIIEKYIVMYRISNEKKEIYIIRVFHGAMNYEKYI